jgi:hypothetical protein
MKMKMVMDAHGDHHADQREKSERNCHSPQGTPNGPGHQLHAQTVSRTQSWHKFFCAAHTPSIYVLISFCFFMFFQARGVLLRFILFLTFQGG